MARWRSAAFFLVSCLVGCGGGGGGGIDEGMAVLDLGDVSASSPTLFELPIGNPLDREATAEVASWHGPLAFEPGALPRTLAAGEAVRVAMALAPQAEGAIDAQVVIRFSAPGNSRQQATRIVAQALSSTMTISPTSLEFGDVAPGIVAEATALVTNTSSLTRLRIAAITCPNPSFTVLTAPLPHYIDPGSTLDVVVRYEASGTDTVGTQSASIHIASNARNGPHTIAATAMTSGRVVVDLGLLAFDGAGQTPAVTFDVPPDATGFMLEAGTDDASTVDLHSLMGPGQKVYENAESTGPYISWPMPTVFVAQVPNSDRAEVQLVSGGGTYTARFQRVSGAAASTAARVTIQRRASPAAAKLAQLDLNVFLAPGIAPKAATAADDTHLPGILAVCDGLLRQQGIALGDVAYYDIDDASFNFPSLATTPQLFQLSSMATTSRLNVFFTVELPYSWGGLAGALGGPSTRGTSASGVAVRYLPNVALIGWTLAHEIGHYVGLDHTFNSTRPGNIGGYDDILDTAPCLSPGGPPCADEDSINVMHGLSHGGPTFTNGQGLVMRTHALLAARSGAFLGKIASPPEALVLPEGIPSRWCGTCQAED